MLGPLLNDYLTGMTDIVFAHDGTVAKIVGDALHVLFGAPGEQPDHAARAVACALALDEYVAIIPRALAAKRASRWASHASVFMPDRRSSAISAAAASSTTQPMATPSTSRRGWKPPTSNSAPAFASAQSSRQRSKDFRGRPVGDLMLRGRTEALRAFEPFGPNSTKIPATKSYLEAFAKLEAGDPGAIAAFAAHVGKRPDDQLASFHLKRLLNGATGTRIAMD